MKKLSKRSLFNAARVDRLTADWAISNQKVDDLLRGSITTIRGHSRDLAFNNDYMRRYLSMVISNIVGPAGIRLQGRVKFASGQADPLPNRVIEQAWREWSKAENCSANQELDWIAAQQVVAESVARDGEIFVRLIRDPGVNPFGFALQFLEADHLDEHFTQSTRDGHEIINGVEFDRWSRPVAYHLFRRHPNALTRGDNRRDRVPAEDVIHVYLKERPSQTRGLPWTTSAMKRLHNLGRYEEAELVAARVSAMKLGFVIPAEGTEYEGDDRDRYGNSISDMSPGEIEELAPGSSFEQFNPDRPNSNYPTHVKAQLRGIAAGLGVSYNSLANDLEAVNFSSIRHGAGEERDHWRVKQRWLTNRFLRPVYEAWLTSALLNGRLNPLSFSNIDRYREVAFVPRGWQYVDPQKEANANATAVDRGFKSMGQVVAEQGHDLDELLEEIKTERQKIEAAGLAFDSKVQAEDQPEGEQEE